MHILSLVRGKGEGELKRSVQSRLGKAKLDLCVGGRANGTGYTWGAHVQIETS